ncbi:hypothetical protein M409DRAFT_22903 [Zasmidium cellare ATCC 36951]|uniref:DUF647 domain-containing protein n=1 Tax=Zasmidium cellare ATCC 36951 TaxID=1080233 RepID=A0A6A6CL08_ZASCE|nr:uncharacterized protein M409DRAFT_22903 [Zasmidium cellare ATCC 36951]KAF2166850.1 hypothetical protein M409DRAFT_22903 [Zasmidium cellare ATCC 36951]
MAPRITEFDEAGNVTATYVQSEGGSQGRVDVIPPSDSKSLWQKGLDVFLPVGYPHSVTHDYLEYQIYDSLQAFSSSIASLLSSRAVLSSVGVGDADASPTAALLLSIFQESIGRLATILFAHRLGMSFEPECKMYRLLADILNDTGFILDMISPVFPKPIRVVILSFSSVLRSLCGVAAGSAKASLSAHFAKWGNLGELNAKDSSQETVISLLGMWAGSLVVSWITSQTATWTALILLLSIHLETNRRAVRAVSMRTLNRQRATLVYHHLKRGNVPTPEEVSKQERIFERDGVLRRSDDGIVGFCVVGASMSRLLRAISEQHATTKSNKLEGDALAKVMSIFETQPYILWCDKRSQQQRPSLFVVLKKGATPKDMLKAWWQALALACDDRVESNDLDTTLKEAERTSNVVNELLKTYEERLEEAGWDLTSSALEVVAGSRVAIEA